GPPAGWRHLPFGDRLDGAHSHTLRHNGTLQGGRLNRPVGPALADQCELGRRAHRIRPIEAGRGGSRMPPARLVGVLVLGAALLAIRPVTAAAQSELQAWLNPEMGKQIPRADYRSEER